MSDRNAGSIDIGTIVAGSLPLFLTLRLSFWLSGFTNRIKTPSYGRPSERLVVWSGHWTSTPNLGSPLVGLVYMDKKQEKRKTNKNDRKEN